jgi:hypothetical protein
VAEEFESIWNDKYGMKFSDEKILDLAKVKGGFCKHACALGLGDIVSHSEWADKSDEEKDAIINARAEITLVAMKNHHASMLHGVKEEVAREGLYSLNWHLVKEYEKDGMTPETWENDVVKKLEMKVERARMSVQGS